jgi:hypothetical protein
MYTFSRHTHVLWTKCVKSGAESSESASSGGPRGPSARTARIWRTPFSLTLAALLVVSVGAAAQQGDPARARAAALARDAAAAESGAQPAETGEAAAEGSGVDSSAQTSDTTQVPAPPSSAGVAPSESAADVAPAPPSSAGVAPPAAEPATAGDANAEPADEPRVVWPATEADFPELQNRQNPETTETPEGSGEALPEISEPIEPPPVVIPPVDPHDVPVDRTAERNAEEAAREQLRQRVLTSWAPHATLSAGAALTEDDGVGVEFGGTFAVQQTGAGTVRQTGEVNFSRGHEILSSGLWLEWVPKQGIRRYELNFSPWGLHTVEESAEANIEAWIRFVKVHARRDPLLDEQFLFNASLANAQVIRTSTIVPKVDLRVTINSDVLGYQHIAYANTREYFNGAHITRTNFDFGPVFSPISALKVGIFGGLGGEIAMGEMLKRSLTDKNSRFVTQSGGEARIALVITAVDRLEIFSRLNFRGTRNRERPENPAEWRFVSGLRVLLGPIDE